MATRYPDTVVDKFILQVFKAVARVPYHHQEKSIQPHKLVISPMIARATTCPAHCGACCEKFSLDYLETEPRPGNLTPRQVELNGRFYTIWSDLQSDTNGRDCKYLSQTDARCSIYKRRPLSCDFELIRCSIGEINRIAVSPYRHRHYWTQQQFRSIYNRPKGISSTVPIEYRPSCEMIDPSEKGAIEAIRKLERLKQWTDHFELETFIPAIISYLQYGNWRYSSVELLP